MSEQQDVIEALEEAGVLAGVRWAYISATSRALEDYSEADGHDAAWLGNHRFTLFRDRLDRVFACNRYSLQPGSAATVSLDLLHAQLSDRDIAALPLLAPDLVRRADLNGSPGWAWQGWRFLLASCAFGKLDRLPWPRKSPTKQRVARQRNPAPPQASLFDELVNDEIAGLLALVTQAQILDLETFVVAHSLDPVVRAAELTFGRARLNNGGVGRAWHWREDLLKAPPADGGQEVESTPPSTSPDNEPDAPVQRRPASERARNQSRENP